MIHPEKISLLRRTHTLVKNFAESIPPALIKEKPSEIAFSVNEIIQHLLEVEELWQRRIHQLLNHEHPAFQQINPDELAKTNNYNEQDFHAGIAAWSDAREDTLNLVQELEDKELSRTGVHSRYGEMDVHRILDIMADHDLQHLAQMERTVKQIKK